MFLVLKKLTKKSEKMEKSSTNRVLTKKKNKMDIIFCFNLKKNTRRDIKFTSNNHVLIF